MAQEIDITTMLEMMEEGTPVIDVRSPSEFMYASIPGAVSIPLFDDDERAQVGTIYKKQSKVKAVQKGLEFVGPKMKDFSKRALALDSQQLIVHCWRGGMRSGAMSWLFEMLGLTCYRLEGGYKAYRNYVLDFFSRPIRFVVLGGRTGAGKTDILKQLEAMGEQVLDLEGLANHKGSAFGSLGESAQPTSEMFDHLIFDVLRRFDKDRVVWVENESINIGKVFIPQPLWKQISQAPIVVVDTEYEVRLARIMRVYASFPTELLCEMIKKIQKRMGYDNAQKAYEACLNGDKQLAARMCLVYYDKLYDRGLKTNESRDIPIFSVKCDTENVEEVAKKIVSLNIFNNGDQ